MALPTKFIDAPSFGRTVRACGLFALGLVVLSAPPARGQSLTEVLEQVMATNPDILTSAANRRAVDQELSQARAGFRPTVEVNAAGGYGVVNNATSRGRPTRGTGSGTVGRTRNDGRLSVSQMLFDGYEVRSEVRRQQARVRSAAHRVHETSLSLAIRAVEVYLEVLRRETVVRLAEDNLLVHADILDKSRTRVELGGGRRANLHQAEARYARAQSQLIQAEGDLREGIVNYERVVGDKPGALVDPDAPSDDLPKTLATGIQTALADNPTIRVATADIEAARSALKGTDAPFYPRLDLELSGGGERNIDGQSGSNSDLTALLRLNYSLYRGGADQARAREAFERVSESQEILASARRAIAEDVRVSWNALETAQERLPAQQEHVAAADQVRIAYRDQFEIGQRTLLDLLDSETELFVARTTLTNGEYMVLFGQFRVLFSTGQLLQALDVATRDEMAPGN